MKSILIILLTIAAFAANAQIFEEEYKECKDPQICLYCGDSIALPTTNLTKYFKWKIEHAPYGYDAKYGKITFELYVDTTGHTCVISIEDRGLNWTLKDDFRKWLNEMTEWRPAVKNGHPINSTVILQADTHREWFSVGLARPVDAGVANQRPKKAPRKTKKHKDESDSSATTVTTSYVEGLAAPQYDYGEFIAKNLHYPSSAKVNGIEGTVLTRFTVSETGALEDITVLQGLGGGCSEEAVRLLKSMPPWKPGSLNRKPVKVNFTLPISFVLKDAEKK